MEKTRILISSSGRTLTLALALGERLQSESCDTKVLTEEGRGQTGSTTGQALEIAVEHVDFGVIVLARDDVIGTGTVDLQNGRDNCFFEAGVFMATIGRERCFLVCSVAQGDLPSNLGGIPSVLLEEPADLNDRAACDKAIVKVAAALADRVQRVGMSGFHGHVPLLSIEELFQRERPRTDGGDLREGEVVVCDTQPIGSVEAAIQVGHNIECGTRYQYFLHFANDTVDKLCQSLQVILVAAVGDAATANDFNARVATVKREAARVVESLKTICQTDGLRITLLPDEPNFCFRVHNASNPVLARLYGRYRGRGFVQWAEGAAALALWRSLPKWLADDAPNRLFVPLKHYEFEGENASQFEHYLDRGIGRYFPGIETEVKRLCIGGTA